MLALALALTAAVRLAVAGAPAPDRAAGDATRAPAAAALKAAALVGPYPSPDSDEGKADLAVVLWEQRTRTVDEVRRAASEVKLTIAAFAGELGGPIALDRRPLTRALLQRAEADARAVSSQVKEQYGRPRPYEADGRVEPAIEREATSSYPSGHATRAVVFARLLAELLPIRAGALLERGRQIGFDRVRVGLHYPSDVAAGQRLGGALADALLEDPAFRARLQEARRREWARPGRRRTVHAEPSPATAPEAR